MNPGSHPISCKERTSPADYYAADGFFSASFMRRSVQQDDFGIAVDPDDVQAVAQAIGAILSDPQRAQQMGENGRQAVLQKYNWDIELKKLLELYDSLSEQNS